MKRVEMELVRSREQLRALAARSNVAREEETRRIAREVHDDLGQKLTGMKFVLQRLQAATREHKDTSALVQSLDELTDRAIESTQAIATELRLGHLDVVGLAGALTWRLREFATRT